MQQVAKGVLEDLKGDAAGAGGVQPPAGPPLAQLLEGAAGASEDGRSRLNAALLALLSYRERALAAEVARLMAAARAAAAAAGAKSAGKAALEAAATSAFEDNLDRVVALGWAHVERFAAANMVDKAAGLGEAGLRPVMGLLASLYALSRIEKDAAFFLASGAMGGADCAAVRAAVNAICARLGGNGGAAARRLCDGFNVPDHCLAPIALDWRQI